MAHHIERPLREASDEMIGFTIVGEDEVTPIDSNIIEAIQLWMRDKEAEPEVLLATNVDVLSQLGPNGAMRLELPAAWMTATSGSTKERQLRLITLKITHSEGKVAYEEITFHLDALQDAPSA